MADNFETLASGLHSPAKAAFSVTPNDSTDLAISSRGVYVGASGDLKVDMVGGGTVTFVGLAAGVVHPLRVKRIYSTGTTATGIIGVY
jgi:hypothetical protein